MAFEVNKLASEVSCASKKSMLEVNNLIKKAKNLREMLLLLQSLDLYQTCKLKYIQMQVLTIEMTKFDQQKEVLFWLRTQT